MGFRQVVVNVVVAVVVGLFAMSATSLEMPRGCWLEGSLVCRLHAIFLLGVVGGHRRGGQRSAISICPKYPWKCRVCVAGGGT